MLRLISIFLFISISGFSSVKDSLLQIVNKGRAYERVINSIKLEHEYRNSDPDSALLFANKAYYLAVDYQVDSLLESVYNTLAITYKLKGNYDTTLYFFQQSLKAAIKLKDSVGISTAYNNLGIFYDDKGERAKSLNYFFKSLYISEKRKDDAEIAVAYNNIGLVHYKNENYKDAEKYYNKSLAIREVLHDTDGTALLYNNIGILYYFEDQPKKCIDYFKKAIKIWRTNNNQRQIAMGLSNIGELYYEIGIYQSALNYLLESQKIYQQLGDISGELYELNLLGKIYQAWGNSEKSIRYYKQAYEKAQQTGAKDLLVDITHNLFLIYQDLNKFKQSNQYLTLYVQYKDSFMNIDKERIMQNLNKKYETQKKEQEIEILNNKNKLNIELNKRNEAEINKQRIVNIALIIGVILILIVVVLIIRQNKIQKKTNEMLLEKNLEIQLQHAEISEQKDEIEAQRDLVSSQKKRIEQIHKHVSQSIDYAKRIQNSTLPDEKTLQKYFTDSFVFFMPRDIVSGDFYWWAHVEGQTVITASDSTGHGVPGAFMSMLGMSLLKEIVVKEYITHPGVILRKLRKEIISSLNQKGEIGGQKDGMDMALAAFNHETNILQFAGANNPLYIITDTQLQVIGKASDRIKLLSETDLGNQDSETKNSKFFYEIKPDKMPIGIYDNMSRFTTHDLQLKKGDQLYMFSDGYADQFGGPKDKKFKYKAFKQLLMKNAHLPMSKQKEHLDVTLKNWMVYTEQVDDIVIVGIKV